jgi:hypothetical protein
MTPYAATRLVNRALRQAHISHPKTGLQKEVQPTMLYVYASKGKFRRVRGDDGRWSIDRESFDTWLEGYVGRLAERQSQREELRDEPQGR